METSPGALVAKNLAELRKDRRVTNRELAERMRQIGYPLLASGVAKIENRQRRVTVDDLIALAAALEVNPNRILLPIDGNEIDVRIGDNLNAKVAQLWPWVLGQQVLTAAKKALGKEDETYAEGQLDFRRHALPPTYRRNEGHAAVVATRDLHSFMSVIVDPDEVPEPLDSMHGIPQLLVENLTWAIHQSLKVLDQQLDSMTNEELTEFSSRVRSLVHSVGAQLGQLQARIEENIGWNDSTVGPSADRPRR